MLLRVDDGLQSEAHEVIRADDRHCDRGVAAFECAHGSVRQGHRSTVMRRPSLSALLGVVSPSSYGSALDEVRGDQRSSCARALAARKSAVQPPASLGGRVHPAVLVARRAHKPASRCMLWCTQPSWIRPRAFPPRPVVLARNQHQAPGQIQDAFEVICSTV